MGKIIPLHKSYTPEEIKQRAKEFVEKCFPKGWDTKQCGNCGGGNCRHNRNCIKCNALI